MAKMELVLGLSESRRWPGWPTSVALRIDTGSPWMNRIVHGFLNVGAVAACKVAAEDTSDYLSQGTIILCLSVVLPLVYRQPGLLFSCFFSYAFSSAKLSFLHLFAAQFLQAVLRSTSLSMW